MIYLNNAKLSYSKIDLRISELIRNIRNDKIKVLRQEKKISKSHQKKYYQNFYLKSYKEKFPSMKLYAIKHKEQFVGYGGLTNIDYINLNAEISFLLKASYDENKSSYKEIFTLFLNDLVKYSKFLNLKKIYTETFYFRKSHLSILEKCNFKFEGARKKQYFKSGKFISSILHGKYL